MASIRVRQTASKNSSWFYQVREGKGENEKKIAYKSGFKTEEEARQAGQIALNDWEVEEYGITPETHLLTLVRYYRRLRHANKILSEGTIRGYDIFEKMVEQYFDMPINSIKASYYQKVFTELGQTKGKTYLARLDSLIRRSLELARNDDVSFRDFTFGMEIGTRKKRKKVEEKYIHKAEDIEKLEKALFKKAGLTYYESGEDTSVYLVLYFLLATGMQYGELVALKWSDLVQDDTTQAYSLKVERRLLVQTEKFVELKSEASYRSVPISDSQADFLLNVIKPTQAILNEEYERENKNDLIFQHPRFKHDVPFSNAVNHLLAQVLHAENIPGTLTVYGLRHSRAAYLVYQEIPTSVIAAYLGHTERMFEKTYRHLLAEKKLKGYAAIRLLPDATLEESR